MLHRNARRDFSVEIKSAGRRGASIIPTREPKSAGLRPKSQPALPGPQASETSAEELAQEMFAGKSAAKPAVKPAAAGRVLPNLIVPEQPPAPIEAEPAEPKARRPYTRRAKPTPAQVPVVALPPPILEPARGPESEPVRPPVVAPRAVVPSDRKRAASRDDAQQLALGQRWKRRLSRWSR